MTLGDWLDSTSRSERHFEWLCLSDRKLHLLTAAFLRRVWDDLPSDLTRIAVGATETHADGRITARELARLRSADLLEACEPLWTDPGYLDEDLIGSGCWCCWSCDTSPRIVEYECQMAREGYVLQGVAAAVRSPGACALRAANFARGLVEWRTDRAEQQEAVRAEQLAQFDLVCEIAGPGWTDPDWPRWRTTDVRALARGIHRDEAFDRLPILADALQDAGCDDNAVLNHCREGKGHVRGCWVVDLAMGIG